jgi:hypothetical protein
MYFPWNWEFGSALSKLQNFGGGGLKPPTPHPRYATGCNVTKVTIALFVITLLIVLTETTDFFAVRHTLRPIQGVLKKKDLTFAIEFIAHFTAFYALPPST